VLRLALPGGGDAEPVETEGLEPPNAAELVAA